MMCCGTTSCRLCVTTKMISDPLNGSRGIATKGQFKCSECKSNCYSNVENDHSLPLQVNQSLRNIIAETQDNFQVFCQNHPDSYALRYCSNHRALLCKDCAYEKHTDHLNSCQELK